MPRKTTRRSARKLHGRLSESEIPLAIDQRSFASCQPAAQVGRTLVNVEGKGPPEQRGQLHHVDPFGGGVLRTFLGHRWTKLRVTCAGSQWTEWIGWTR